MAELNEKVTKLGKDILDERINRLKKLYELKAPNLILVREVFLIEEALWLVAPKEMADAVQEREYRQIKKKIGFCLVLSCGNSPIEGQDLCSDCLKAYEENLDIATETFA